MKLYYHPISTYSQKALIAFYEKNVKFEPVLVDLMDPAKKAEFKKIYPMGKVPVVIRDDGWMIPESSIIIEFLEGTYNTGTQLIPTEKEAARQARFLDRMSDLYVNEPCTTLVFGGMKPADVQNNPLQVEKMKNARATLDSSYAAINKNLEGKKWLMGDQFSMGDCSFIPSLAYLRMVYPFDAYPNITSYWSRAVERPSVKKTLDEAAPYLAKFGKK